MLLAFVDNIYGSIESVNLVCHDSFCQINDNSSLIVICKQYKTQALFTLQRPLSALSRL